MGRSKGFPCKLRVKVSDHAESSVLFAAIGVLFRVSSVLGWSVVTPRMEAACVFSKSLGCRRRVMVRPVAWVGEAVPFKLSPFSLSVWTLEFSRGPSL